MRPVPRSSQGVISTRAPTRGATQGADFPERNQSIISTRAPTRGATPPAARSSARPAISTRTPTRGATRLSLTLFSPVRGFLLAPLREGRQQFFTKPQVDLYDKLLKNSHFSN